MTAKAKQKRPLHYHLMTVTPLSKTIAFILFILMPFIGFYLGMQYQKTVDSYNVSSPAPTSKLQAK